MIAPERDWIPGRRESRARVVASGLSDSDIDQLIKQAQREVEPPSA
jgi:ribosomal protein L12E/L44/L45/RPP1/RPP2